MVKIFIGVIVGLIILFVCFSFIDTSTVVNGTITSSVDASSSLTVSISGEITRSGTYVLDANTTLESLISLASGVTSNADERAYNLDYMLEDGLSFYIAPKYDTTDVCSYEPIEKVNINDDTSSELQAVNGIGSSIASSIVSYREENGSFGRIEDIKNVSGIGNATFEKIKDYIMLKD